MDSEGPSQWLFTDAEINCTPSTLDKLPIVEERCRRAKGVNFIIQAGILLKLPQLTLATASVFFHRFYMRSSMVPERGGLHHYVWYPIPLEPLTTDIDIFHQNIAATALFLATKTEENCRKTKEIVIAVAKVAQKNASLIIDEQSKEYWRWRDNILLYEELMLECLTFDVVLQSPYNFLYGFLQRLQIEDNKQLRNVAWAYLNDSCLTMLCLQMSPKDIAIGALYFAAKFTGEKIPDDEHGEPWWTQLGGRPDLIIKAVAVIYEFYSENPLKRSENPYAQSPSSVANEDDLDGTRMRTFHSSLATPSPEGMNRSQRSQDGNVDHATGAEDLAPVLNNSETPVESKTVEDLGSSDAALKEAANDPATHEGNSHSNGMVGLVPTSTRAISESVNPSPKRKAGGAAEPAAKKAKVDSDEAEGAPDSAESEDGELKE